MSYFGAGPFCRAEVKCEREDGDVVTYYCDLPNGHGSSHWALIAGGGVMWGGATIHNPIIDLHAPTPAAPDQAEGPQS